MGNSQPATKGQVLSGPGAQAAQPPEPPYPGPTAQYQFVNTQVMMSNNITFGFMNSRIITSNVESYYPILAQQYDQGFRMLTFYHIPGQVKRAGGLFSTDVLMPFQGIFCRYPQIPSAERFQLRIEKSVIQPQMQWNGFITTRTDVVTDTSHLLQTIANNTQAGGRLICIELTGHEEIHPSLGMHRNYRMPVCGVDLFFEIPLSGNQEQYVYNIACVPITINRAGTFSNRLVAQCDWLGVMAQYLGQGYKLIEIFMDQTQTTQQHGFSATIIQNSQWFFEKPLSRRDDPTPVYQGTMVEHMITVSQSGFSGTTTTANWEPIIQNMGNKGWELACILETPEIHMAGFGSYQMKVLLFFQRKIMY